MINHFNFKKCSDGSFLITNDMGRHAFLSPGEFSDFFYGKIKPGDALYDKLHEGHFILEPMDIYSTGVIGHLSDMKSYLSHGPSLHIFVVTNQCNLSCVYCQAQHHKSAKKGFMTIETGRKSIDIALSSPDNALTFEFQGGEPLLNFPVIRDMIEYSEEHKGSKNIEYTIVSNFFMLTEEIAEFLSKYRVSICTSLDGPKALQNKNRRSLGGKDSYSKVLEGMKLMEIHGQKPGAIQTTTRYSLPLAGEIVGEYQKQGLSDIFIRPLTPLGFASEAWEEIGYTAEEFLKFYRECFDEILAINRNGTFFREQHAEIFLEKIFKGTARNYMELRSPCGAGSGQLAYYYDGEVYSCDEARMLAEAGNPSFRLGNVYENTLSELMHCNTCKNTCGASITETIPGCCDCVYQPYCGVCPVINLAIEGNIFKSSPKGYRCDVYRGILDFLFELIRENNPETMKILHSWVGADVE